MIAENCLQVEVLVGFGEKDGQKVQHSCVSGVCRSFELVKKLK